MMARITAFREVSQKIGGCWGTAVDVLKGPRLWPKRPKTLDQLEGAVQVALPPVKPTADFRRNLRSDLALAAQSKVSGLVIEYPKPFREGIILGVAAGLFAAAVTAIVLLFHSRLSRAER